MKKLKKENLVMPKFVEDPASYVKALDVIAKDNFIDWAFESEYHFWEFKMKNKESILFNESQNSNL